MSARSHTRWDVVPTGLLILALLVGAYLRTDRLAEIPIGVDYDEAGNYILAREIAAGDARPLFIRAYAGREAIFYWLAAASMRLFGENLFAFRLAAAICGLATVLFTYALARELLREAPSLIRRWTPPLSAAIAATSYWHVHVSRYGFRANVMPVFVAGTMLLLWRGLRRARWIELVAAGLLCGLSANTYLAIRAFPLLLLPVALWAVLAFPPQAEDGVRDAGTAPGSWRRTRLLQVAVFALAAALAFAPLGVFYLRNPSYFGLRMGQASVFDPEIHGGDLWGTLGRVTLQALGAFTVRGDADPIYNTPGRPIYGPWLGAAFYLGLLVCLYRAVRAAGSRPRTAYLLLLVWLPVMLVPNILGARGVPHALRSIGLIPAVYIVAGLGLAAAATLPGTAMAFLRKNSAGTPAAGRAGHALAAVLFAVTLVAGGMETWSAYFQQWAHSAGAYYRGSASLRRAAAYLDGWDADEVALWVGDNTYRHTSYAAMSANYSHLRWFSEGTLVFPLGESRPALYLFDFTNPLDPLLARYLPADALQHRDLGPDGGVGFEAYLLPRARMPDPAPQLPAGGNLGNAVALLGYDLNAPPELEGVLDLTLYWRVTQDAGRDDYAFFVHLVDDLGFRWGGETFFSYPSAQWRAGDVILFRRQIEVAPGAPPGAYWLDLGVYSASLDARLPLLNDAGQMAGTSIRAGPVDVVPATGLPDVLPPIEQMISADYGGGLALLGADRDRGDVRPGEALALTLYWQADEPIPQRYQVAIWLQGTAEDARLTLWQGDPAHGRYPFDRWRAPTLVRDRYALRLPADAPPGDYDLRLALLDAGGTPLPVRDAQAVSLYTMHVQATDRTWEPPPFEHPVGARLGDRVELLGYDLSPQQAAPGDPLHLTLVWRCLSEMDTDYTVFTHLLDAGERVWGQQDNPPVGGSYPTTLWLPGEVVVDAYEIVVWQDAPPGSYVIEAGMYDPADIVRLPVIDPSGTTGDRVLLGSVEVR